MSEILRYVTISPDDQEGDQEYDSKQDAIDAAPEGHAVIMRAYECTDSELVWTPDGSSTWPPRRRVRA